VGALEAWEELDPPWRVAFELAWEAFQEGTVPVGAVVVDEDGMIVAQGRNRIFASSAPARQIAGTRLAHAELNALAQLSTDRRWKTCTLYTTLEPCILCVAAASVATVGTIRFAGTEPFSGSSNVATIDLGIPRPLDLAIEGPLDGPFELLGTALHLAFFAEDADRNGAMVGTYAARRPEVLDVASALLGAKRGSLRQALETLDLAAA
jgi:tRNA(Arg) A34 adenosine deaminase TadA